MKRSPAPTSHPALLSPGTEVGSWRVVAWAGQGANGVIFQAVRIGQEHAGPVALKLALLPDDPRLAREVAVLARVEHPSVPRLLDSGEWQHPGGTRHPFLIMEWVEGMPLYEWADRNSHHPEQMLRLLAQVASALQAIHDQGALHRDVKGANILVRACDSRAVLTDFGVGIYAGATTLTPPALVSGTPAYRSPEAALLELHSLRNPQARYVAGPADDVYALGVTACRLVTGAYPELGEPHQNEQGHWQLESVVLPPALREEGRVEPPLRELILRMLSVRPEERGAAAELAELLEQAAERMAVASGPKGTINEPLRCSSLPPESTPTSELAPQSARDATQHFTPPAHIKASWCWAAASFAALALVAWALWGMPRQFAQRPCLAQEVTAESSQSDAGTVGLGDTASTVSEERPRFSGPDVMSEDALPEPIPGQIRPDAKGRCPGKRQVVLNGACWLKASWDREECAVARGQMFNSTCYAPCVPPGRQPTSNPP